MECDSQKFCTSCLCLSGFTLLILLISSFSSLDVNEYGIDYSSISKTVAKVPYSAGIHFLGIGHHFIKFPRTVQTIEFSSFKSSNGPPLQSRTSDGLEVILEISFQYKVILNDLQKLYLTYSSNYEYIFERMSINQLTEIATHYTAYEFFKDRNKIGNDMQQKLNIYFTSNCYSTIDFFQLRSVDLPDKFEIAIQQSEVKKQEIQQAYAEKNKSLVTLQTQELKAELQKNATINLAYGDAQAILTQVTANANSYMLVQQTQAKADQVQIVTSDNY